MESSPKIARTSIDADRRLWIGVLLLVGGLLGHLLAAQAIGGNFVAYRDHTIGFVGATVVSGAIIAMLGRRFWKGRTDVTVLILGILQALFGLVIYVMRFEIG